MGRVTVTARIENIYDLFAADQGQIEPSQVRFVQIDDALVDTGAWGLAMPATMLAGLGLKYLYSRQSMTSGGPREVRMFGTVRLTIQERGCPADVTELPDGCPVLIGQIPLEAMDFVVDLRQRKVIGNPAHGGEQMIELY